MRDVHRRLPRWVAVAASLAAAAGFAQDFDVRRFGAAGDGASDDTRLNAFVGRADMEE